MCRYMIKKNLKEILYEKFIKYLKNNQILAKSINLYTSTT